MKGKVLMEMRDLLDLIYYARRYCDGRRTYAPFEFNSIYKRLLEDHPEITKGDLFDKTLNEGGKNWPYASNGDFELKSFIE